MHNSLFNQDLGLSSTTFYQASHACHLLQPHLAPLKFLPPPTLYVANHNHTENTKQTTLLFTIPLTNISSSFTPTRGNHIVLWKPKHNTFDQKSNVLWDQDQSHWCQVSFLLRGCYRKGESNSWDYYHWESSIYDDEASFGIQIQIFFGLDLCLRFKSHLVIWWRSRFFGIIDFI